MAARPVLSLLSLTLVLVLTDTALALPQLSPVGEPLDPCFPIRPCRCPFGTVWSIDARGCPRCSCKPGCPPLCRMYCPNGFERDSNGCQICKCKPPIKPICPPLCEMYCPNGFERDSNGCQICKCKPPIKPVCPRQVCNVYCRYGYKLDSNGCRTCTCKSFECPPIMCPAVACPPGHVNDVDRNGCRIGCGCRRVGFPELDVPDGMQIP